MGRETGGKEGLPDTYGCQYLANPPLNLQFTAL